MAKPLDQLGFYFFYGTRGNRSLLNNGRKYMQKTIQNGTKNEPKRNKKRSKTVKRRSIMVQKNDTKKYTKRYKKTMQNLTCYKEMESVRYPDVVPLESRPRAAGCGKHHPTPVITNVFLLLKKSFIKANFKS